MTDDRFKFLGELFKSVMMACVSIKCPLQLWLNPHPARRWEARRLPHQSESRFRAHIYSPIGIHSSPPHKLQHFEMQLWISEQRHQSQFLLIFIERSGSRYHLYIREPAVIKRRCVDRGGFAFSISPSVTLDAFNPPPARHSSACSAAENELLHLHV